MQLTIGIDVSKDLLDAHRLSDRQHIQVTNDKAGRKALIGWIGKADLPLIVFEATGAYHRQLEAALGGFQREAQRFKQTGSRRPCQAPTGTPRPGTGSRGICAG